MKSTKKTSQAFDAAIDSGRSRCQKFNSVASGDNQTFVERFLIDERRQRARQKRFSEREPLAHLERRRLMTQSYEYDVHCSEVRSRKSEAQTSDIQLLAIGLQNAWPRNRTPIKLQITMMKLRIEARAAARPPQPALIRDCMMIK